MGRVKCPNCGFSIILEDWQLPLHCNCGLTVGERQDQEACWTRPGDCVHRGSVVGQVVCELCGSKGKIIDAYACAVHGTCTIKRYRVGGPDAVCLGCPDHQLDDPQSNVH